MTQANLSLIFENTSAKKVVILKVLLYVCIFFFFKILKAHDDDSDHLYGVNSSLENVIKETIEKFENDKRQNHKDHNNIHSIDRWITTFIPLIGFLFYKNHSVSIHNIYSRGFYKKLKIK